MGLYPPVIKHGTLLIGDFPIETTISSWFPIATLDDTGGYFTRNDATLGWFPFDTFRSHNSSEGKQWGCQIWPRYYMILSQDIPILPFILLQSPFFLGVPCDFDFPMVSLWFPYGFPGASHKKTAINRDSWQWCQLGSPIKARTGW